MIILGIIVTIVIGVIGTSIGYGMNAAELGPILSIATMGGFIMAYIKKNNIKTSPNIFKAPHTPMAFSNETSEALPMTKFESPPIIFPIIA